MTPTKITLEIVSKTLRLRVDAPDTLKGYSVIEATTFSARKPKASTVELMRSHAGRYAKRFGIEFSDLVA
jgi:hypothetical protein